jgi:hypothetical protein
MITNDIERVFKRQRATEFLSQQQLTRCWLSKHIKITSRLSQRKWTEVSWMNFCAIHEWRGTLKMLFRSFSLSCFVAVILSSSLFIIKITWNWLGNLFKSFDSCRDREVNLHSPTDSRCLFIGISLPSLRLHREPFLIIFFRTTEREKRKWKKYVKSNYVKFQERSRSNKEPERSPDHVLWRLFVCMLNATRLEARVLFSKVRYQISFLFLLKFFIYILIQHCVRFRVKSSRLC